MRKPGRPPKIRIQETVNATVSPTKAPANRSLLEVALEKAKELYRIHSDRKIAICSKYRTCEIFKEGAEYKAILSREIGQMEGIQSVITEIQELLK